MFIVPQRKTIEQRLKPVLSSKALPIFVDSISNYAGTKMEPKGVVNVVLLAIDDYAQALEREGDPQARFSGSIHLGRLDEIVPALYPHSPINGQKLINEVKRQINAIGDHRGRRLALLAREMRAKSESR